jgi:hypothetical protein
VRCALAASAALLAAGLLAPGAAAMPGDPPIDVLGPPDGATVPVDPDGIPVSFTCPVYRLADPGFPLFGGPKDYGTSMSRSPALGPDGRLAEPDALGQGSETPPSGSAQCTGGLGAGGAARPQETPGTWYWQVWRLCTGCPSGYETAPVRRLVIRSEARAILRKPGRVYAGYAFLAKLSLPGVPDRTAVRIERRVGKRWRALASGQALGGRAELVLALKRGTHTLRAVASIGSQRVESAPRRLSVAPARRWTTGAGDDGSYSGRAGSRSVSLRVSGGGRIVRGFSAQVAMLCPGNLPGQFTTQIAKAFVSRIKVAPDGSFIGVARPDRRTAIQVTGRLRRGAASGRVSLSLGACVGNSKFSARRAVSS